MQCLCVAIAVLLNLTSTDALALRFEIQLDGNITLLKPDPNVTTGSYFLVHADSRVHAFDRLTGRSLLPNPIKYTHPPRWLAGTSSGFILASQFQIFEHRLKKPFAGWTVGKRPEKANATNADPETSNPIRRLVVHGDHIFIVREDGGVQCIDRSSGAVVWQRRINPKPVGPIRVVDGVLTYVSRIESTETLNIISTGTGQPIARFELPRGETVLDQFPGATATVVRLASGLMGIDSQSGKARWRIDGQPQLNVGHVAADSLGVYISIDGHQVAKFSRNTGERVWRFEGTVVGPKVQVELSVVENRILIRSESFVQVLSAADGHPLARVQALPPETIQHTVIQRNTLWVVLKPKAKQLVWTIHSEPLEDVSTQHQRGKRFDLQAFPQFKDLAMFPETMVVQDGDRIVGLALARVGSL